eukprot:3395154-Prymnesium_polylepis.1
MHNAASGCQRQSASASREQTMALLANPQISGVQLQSDRSTQRRPDASYALRHEAVGVPEQLSTTMRSRSSGISIGPFNFGIVAFESAGSREVSARAASSELPRATSIEAARAVLMPKIEVGHRPSLFGGVSGLLDLVLLPAT